MSWKKKGFLEAIYTIASLRLRFLFPLYDNEKKRYKSTDSLFYKTNLCKFNYTRKKSIEEEALGFLKTCELKGNVRELKKILSIKVFYIQEMKPLANKI